MAYNYLSMPDFTHILINHGWNYDMDVYAFPIIYVDMIKYPSSLVKGAAGGRRNLVWSAT